MRSLLIYQNHLVRALLMLKYQRMEPLARWFAARMVQLVPGEGEAFEADLVVTVPLRRSREREGGHNPPAALLAKPLAKALRLPYRPVLLVRTRANARKKRCCRWRSAGRPSVAPLPHARAAKLTSYASYW